MIHQRTSLNSENINEIGNNLKQGGIGIIPTDTIYGIVGSALNPETIERIYELRKREKNKPMIILLSSLKDLERFEVRLSEKQEEFLIKNWPNSLSVVLRCESEKFKYLHRGKNSLAFRIPKDKFLLDLLSLSGPLVAPSANFEGEKPSEIIDQAINYFGKNVDFYIDGGKLVSTPSTLIKLNGDASFEIIRQGSYRLQN